MTLPSDFSDDGPAGIRLSGRNCVQFLDGWTCGTELSISDRHFHTRRGADQKAVAGCGSATMSDCTLLDALPAEIRLRIYEELYDETYHSSLLIRSDSKIELISLAKAHGAILKTCRTIYREAAPILYDTTTFRVQIYPVEGYSSHGNVNRLQASTPFLRRIRHVEIKSCIILPIHIEPALRLMKTFACALEDSDARIKTMNVRSKLFNDMSKRRLNEYREKLAHRDEPGLDGGKCQLFQKMIDGASNGNGMVSISLESR